nr:hypothetical protein [Tanacetum cinerariifolium]
MVNTRTDADLSAAVQNALQTLLPQIRAEIREEFRTSSGSSDAGGNPPPLLVPRRSRQRTFSGVFAEIREEFRIGSGQSGSGGNPPPVTIHTWLERFNKQKTRSFEKATAPFFPRAEQERLKKEYHSIRQTNTETSTEFMQRFLRLAGFLGAAAERPDKRQKSGDRHQPTSQQSSHRNHGHNNDRHGSDRRGGSDNHRSSNNNYSGSNNRNSSYGLDQRNRGQQSNRSTNYGSQQSRGPSEGDSYPVCTTCGRKHPGECRRAAGTCF